MAERTWARSRFLGASATVLLSGLAQAQPYGGPAYIEEGDTSGTASYDLMLGPSGTRRPIKPLKRLVGTDPEWPEWVPPGPPAVFEITCFVLEDGSVRQCRAHGPSRLEDVALRAVNGWKFATDAVPHPLTYVFTVRMYAPGSGSDAGELVSSGWGPAVKLENPETGLSFQLQPKDTEVCILHERSPDGEVDPHCADMLPREAVRHLRDYPMAGMQAVVLKRRDGVQVGVVLSALSTQSNDSLELALERWLNLDDALYGFLSNGTVSESLRHAHVARRIDGGTVHRSHGTRSIRGVSYATVDSIGDAMNRRMLMFNVAGTFAVLDLNARREDGGAGWAFIDELEKEALSTIAFPGDKLR